jgi:hypothetical protein
MTGGEINYIVVSGENGSSESAAWQTELYMDGLPECMLPVPTSSYTPGGKGIKS